MAILPIMHYGEPVLRERARPVGRVDKSVRKLMEDMFETMEGAPGIGLAAPQVGASIRVVVAQIDDDRHLIANPRVLETRDEDTAVEACLSLPGIQGEVSRPWRIVVAGFNRNGRPMKIEAEGLLARCLCHEMDHLDGRVFLDRALSDTISHPVLQGEDEDGDPIYQFERLTREQAFEWLLARWKEGVPTNDVEL